MFQVSIFNALLEEAGSTSCLNALLLITKMYHIALGVLHKGSWL